MEISEMIQKSIAHGCLMLPADETTALMNWIRQVEASQKEYAKITTTMEQELRFIRDVVK